MGLITIEFFSLFSEDGAVFVWGSGGEGQLGMGGKTECPEPEELRIEDHVTCIACGYYHTALVTGIVLIPHQKFCFHSQRV